jgi:hypothetical protein
LEQLIRTSKGLRKADPVRIREGFAEPRVSIGERKCSISLGFGEVWGDVVPSNPLVRRNQQLPAVVDGVFILGG